MWQALVISGTNRRNQQVHGTNTIETVKIKRRAKGSWYSAAELERFCINFANREFISIKRQFPKRMTVNQELFPRTSVV